MAIHTLSCAMLRIWCGRLTCELLLSLMMIYCHSFVCLVAQYCSSLKCVLQMCWLLIRLYDGDDNNGVLERIMRGFKIFQLRHFLLFLWDDGIICQLRHCSYISMKVKVSRRLRRRFLPSMEYVGLAKLGFVTSPVGIISPWIPRSGFWKILKVA